MNWILRLAWILFKDRIRSRALNKVKRKGVIAYIRTLQGTRRLLLIAFGGFLLMQTIMLGAVGALVTAFLLWNYEYAMKLEILFGVFLGIFLVPFGLILFFLSERFWFKFSGAEKMLEELRAEDESRAA